MSTVTTFKERNEAICAFVERFTAEHGYGPTMRAIGEAFGIASTSSVHRIVHALADAGRLRVGEKAARGSITLAHPRPQGPAPAALPLPAGEDLADLRSATPQVLSCPACGGFPVRVDLVERGQMQGLCRTCQAVVTVTATPAATQESEGTG